MISQPASGLCRCFLIAVLMCTASACSTQPNVRKHPVVKSAPANASQVGARAAAVAVRQVGTPYRYGGNDPRGFDCSGLVQFSYARVGKSLPRTTTALWKYATPVDDRSMRAGDLLFFSISGKMSHVGLYLGDGRFAHAPSTGKSVSVENLHSDYYRRAFIRAGRPR